jgi:hypothetical protein
VGPDGRPERAGAVWQLHSPPLPRGLLMPSAFSLRPVACSRHAWCLGADRRLQRRRDRHGQLLVPHREELRRAGPPPRRPWQTSREPSRLRPPPRMPCASVQMAGRTLGMDSFWKHASSPSDHEWRRAIDRCR